MARRIGDFLRRFYVIGSVVSDIPEPPVETYYPKMDFTDARNSMYSMGGF